MLRFVIDSHVLRTLNKPSGFRLDLITLEMMSTMPEQKGVIFGRCGETTVWFKAACAD